MARVTESRKKNKIKKANKKKPFKGMLDAVNTGEYLRITDRPFLSLNLNLCIFHRITPDYIN